MSHAKAPSSPFSNIPIIAVMALCYGFFIFLMFLYVQLNITLPIEEGEISSWFGSALPIMIGVNAMWMVLLVVDALARGKTFGPRNRTRFVTNVVACLVLGIQLFNFTQWQTL